MSMALALILNTARTCGSFDSEGISCSSANASLYLRTVASDPFAVAAMPSHCLIGSLESFPKLSVPLTLSSWSSVEARLARKRQSWIVRNSKDEMGYVRVVFGAFDVKRQCS